MAEIRNRLGKRAGNGKQIQQARAAGKAQKLNEKHRRQQRKDRKILIQDVLGDFSDQTGAYF